MQTQTPIQSADSHSEDDFISQPAPIEKRRDFGRAIARNSGAIFWALAGQGVFSITRFFSKMVVGGRFGDGQPGYGSEAELAYYDAAFGIMLLVLALHEALITTPLTFFNHRLKKISEQTFAGRMLMLSLLFSVAGLIGTLLVTWYQASVVGISDRFLWAMIALSILIPFQSVKEFARRWLLANLAVRQSTLMELGFAACFILLVGVLIFAAQVNAAAVFAITVLSNFLCLCSWWAFYRNSFSMSLNGVGEQATENLRVGRWIAGENVSSVVMMYFSQWYLISLVSEKDAGVYTACLTIVFLSNPFILGISSIFAPRAAKEFEEHGWTGLLPILQGYSLFVVGVLVAFSGTLYFFGGPLTELAFGSQYADFFADSGGKNWLTFILSLATPCFGFSFLLTCCILAADKPLYCFYAAIFGTVVTIVINLVFDQPTPYTAAISFVAGAFATMVFRFVIVWKLYRNHQTQTALASDG